MAYKRATGDIIMVFQYKHELYKVSNPLLQLDSETGTRGHPLKMKKKMMQLKSVLELFLNA